MTHQDQILEIIDRSNDKIRWDFYDVIIICLSIIALLISLISLFAGLNIFDLSFLISFGFLFFLFSKKAGLDYHNYDIGLSKVILKSREIQISSKNPGESKVLRLQDIEYLSVKYSGFDEGPRHILWAPNAKRGDRNIITIKDNSNYFFEAEFYLKYKRQSIVLRNNIQYYHNLGIKEKPNK
jgi:hypothetical protein